MIALMLMVMLTPAEERGRETYVRGARATAIVAGATELPAASLPCVSCHGHDRRGVPEGTVLPPDIRWSVLSRGDFNRPRPKYDAALLRRAITEGVDANGRKLSPVMPRYRMSTDALNDLVAFLSRDAPDPGLTDTTITIATSPVMRPVVAAYSNDVNAAGGINGRSLQLTDSTSDAFALIGASDRSLDRIPVITPFATSMTETTFALYADLTTQTLALSKSIDASRNVVVDHDGTPAALAAAAALTPRDSFPPSDDDVLYLLGDIDVEAILARLESQKWKPRILAAGVRRALAQGRRITRAVPTIPADVTPDAHSELLAFAKRHALPSTAAELATYATMKVFAEALQRAGRELTRESLIGALERLYDHPTGLTPPVTFHKSRHIGGAGAWIVDVDSGRAQWMLAR